MLVYGCSENDTPPLEEPSDSRYSIAITVKTIHLRQRAPLLLIPEKIYMANNTQHVSNCISISRKTRTIPVWQVKI